MDKKGKLNTFQQAILQWEELHPYNAIHVVKIEDKLDATRLKDIIVSHIERLGLSGLVVDRDSRQFTYSGGKPDIDLSIYEWSGDSTLSDEIERQINTPFRPRKGVILPFRFFVIKKHDSFYLGLVYYHLIASADSIIVLLKSIIDHYKDKSNPSILPVFNLYPPVYRIPFKLKYISGWLLTLPEHISSMKRASRPKYHDMNDFSTGFKAFNIIPPYSLSIIEKAKEIGVTVNDMFLGLLMLAISPLASQRNNAKRRRNISVASIVNIRDDLSIRTEDFGVFLSYFNVSHEVPEGVDLITLVKDIHGQTERIKKYRLYLRTVLELHIALFLIRSLFRKRKEKFFPKYNPLWGGITNINLNNFWAGGNTPSEYLRAVSTGPATPLVLSFTTLHDTISVGLSYRKTVFSESDIKKIIHTIFLLISDV